MSAKWHLVLLILLACWTSGYAYDVYTIDACVNENCLTLSDIVNEREKYFTSNVTLVFHPGDHSLQGGAVSVANVRNLTLQGSTTSSSSGAPVTRIVCDNSSLSFSDVSDLQIVSINFVSCRNVLSFTVSVFQNCSFENSTAVNGGAMAVKRGSNVAFLGLTVFTGNTATLYGGAIFATYSNITFSGKTIFAVNHVHSEHFSGGGAIYANYSTITFSGITTFAVNYVHSEYISQGGSFEVNEAISGGAVYAGTNNILSFNGNSSFDRNTARLGGALCAYTNNILSFSGNSSFEGNTAKFSGGALYAADWDNTLSFSGNSNFEGNRAKEGGALNCHWNSNCSFSGTTTFNRNSADRGGALYAGQSSTLSFSENSSFEGNTADRGGALYSAYYNRFNFSGFTSFKQNKASTGGALHCSNSEVLFAGRTFFLSNTAKISGGAIYAVDSVTQHPD